MRVLMVSSQWPTADQPYLSPFLGQQAEALREIGVDVDVLPFQLRKRPTRIVKARGVLKARLRTGAYDVVHVHFGWNGFWVGRTSVPQVVTFYGSDLMGNISRGSRYTLGGRISQMISRRSARRADGVIAVSKSLARRLPSGVTHTVIPLGVDLEVFKPASQKVARDELGLSQEARLVLFANPQRAEKRFDLACESVEIMRGANPVELVTVQGVPPEVVCRYMNACDVLLLTSAHEGSPAIVKEALATNLPVVSVDVGDVREWIGSLAGCAVCPDDRPATIAAALSGVLQRAEEFDGRRVAREVAHRMIAERTRKVYEEVLKAKSGARRGVRRA